MKYYFTGVTRDPANPPGPTLPSDEWMSEREYLSQFSWLYSAYSWPNVILPLLGGIMSDRLGLRFGNLIFAGLVLAGQCVFALGMTLPGTSTKWAVMIAGRVFFGFGGESLSVTMSALIAKWFGGRELALALGVNLALARLGSVFNDAASPALAGTFGLAGSLWGGAVICAISFACAVAVYMVDLRASVLLRANRHKLRASGGAGETRTLLTADGGGGGGVAVQVSGAEDAGVKTVDDADDEGEDYDDEDEEDGGDDEVVDLRAVLKLPLTLWVLTVSCVTVYAAILSFNNIAADFIVTRWPAISSDTANYYMAVTYTTAGLVSPFLGAFIDRIGMRAIFVLAAAVVVTGVHLLLGLTLADPIIGLVFLGLAYAFYAAALWPSIALVTDDAIVGTAYGFTTAVQNLGLAGVPLLIAFMQNHCPSNYECVSITFAAFSACGIVSGIALQIIDARSRVPMLNLPEAQIRKRKQEMSRISRAEKSRARAGLRDAEAQAGAEFGVMHPSPKGTPRTPLLEDGLAGGLEGESVTGLSLPPTGMDGARAPSARDLGGMSVGDSSPPMSGAVAARGSRRSGRRGVE
jgi:MFS family permease